MERYWQILETIVAAGKPLSPAEIAAALDIPRATTYRLINELAELAIIDAVDQRQQYVLGKKFVTLALLGKSDSDVSRAVSSALQKLANQYGQTAFISRIRGDDIELTHVELPENTALAFIYPGLGKRPIHACSSAKAIVAFADKTKSSRLLRQKFDKFTNRTMTSMKLVAADLAEVKARGFAVCDQEIDDGVVSIAAPVNIPKVGVMFSIGFVGPSKAMYEHLDNGVGEDLVKAAEPVAVALRHCSPLEASRATKASEIDICQQDWPTGMLV